MEIRRGAMNRFLSPRRMKNQVLSLNYILLHQDGIIAQGNLSFEENIPMYVQRMKRSAYRSLNSALSHHGRGYNALYTVRQAYAANRQGFLDPESYAFPSTGVSILLPPSQSTV